MSKREDNKGGRRQLVQMDLDLMRQLREQLPNPVKDRANIGSKLGILNGVSNRMGSISNIMTNLAPFVINDYRCMAICSGTMKTNINLIDYECGPNTLAFVGPGTVIEPHSGSLDCKVMGMIMAQELFNAIPSENVSAIIGAKTTVVVHVEPEEMDILRTLIELANKTSNIEELGSKVTTSIVNCVLTLINDIVAREEKQNTNVSHGVKERGQVIFREFLELVRSHSKEHHQLEFYAERIHVTPRYLGTTVKRQSGTSAKEWIDRALLTQIKVYLLHTDKTVRQIADELKFESDVSLCKFFKRRTGVSALIWRLGECNEGGGLTRLWGAGSTT